MADVLILNLRKSGSSIRVADSPTWQKRNPASGLDRICPDEEAAATCAGRRVCVFVHGYRVDDALDAYAQLADRVEDWYDVLVYVAWPGGSLALAYIPWWLKRFTPWDVFDRATRAGALLRKALAPLRAAALDVQTHSLGARVGLTAVSGGLVVRNLLLSAPAVPRGCLRPGEEFAAAPQNCRTLVVACAQQDSVLAGAFVFAEWSRALGSSGPLPPVPLNVVVLTCTDVRKHSGYKASADYLSRWHELAV